MVTITCYGGVGQIGGNQFLLEDGDTRLFFDFGTPYGTWNRFYEEYLKPRTGAGLLDPLVMGLLPPLEGLYRVDLEASGSRMWQRVHDRPGYRPLEGANGVLLSHAHLDHSGYISFVRSDVPVFASAMTAFIAKATQDTGGADFEKEVCYFRPRQPKENGALGTAGGLVGRPFVFVDAAGLPEGARAFWEQSPLKGRRLTPVAAQGTPGWVGGKPLRAFPVDHSIYGATVFAVETSAGWIASTGDVRLDWTPEERTRRLVEGLKALRLRALLCEGTRAGEEGSPVMEESVAERIRKEVQGARGLVIADFGPRNIHRLKTVLEVARSVGRKLVVTTKDAYLLDAMARLEPDTPTGRDPDIFIYRALKVTAQSWEQGLREKHESRLIGPEEIGGSPDAFLLCFSFWDMKEVVDINPRGGLYIYSSSEAHSEDQQMDLRRLRNWIDYFQMRPIGLPRETPEGEFIIPDEEKGLHASGHATGAELIRLVQEVHPQTVIPIHTERPDFFAEALKGTGIEVIQPQYGKPIPLS